MSLIISASSFCMCFMISFFPLFLCFVLCSLLNHWILFHRKKTENLKTKNCFVFWRYSFYSLKEWGKNRLIDNRFRNGVSLFLFLFSLHSFKLNPDNSICSIEVVCCAPRSFFWRMLHHMCQFPSIIHFYCTGDSNSWIELADKWREKKSPRQQGSLQLYIMYYQIRPCYLEHELFLSKVIQSSINHNEIDYFVLFIDGHQTMSMRFSQLINRYFVGRFVALNSNGYYIESILSMKCWISN